MDTPHVLCAGNIKAKPPCCHRTVCENVVVKQAANETGSSYHCLRNLCLSGKIAHIRSGNKYMINSDRLEDYLVSKGFSMDIIPQYPKKGNHEKV